MADPSKVVPQEPADVQLWQRWRQGARVDVAAFLAGFPNLAATELVAVLLIDQSERWRLGERIPAENYLRRYPSLEANTETVLSPDRLEEWKAFRAEAEQVLRSP